MNSKDGGLNFERNQETPIATKENFWDFIEKDCPKMFAKFSHWVDEYKLRNNWERSFGNLKIHELPMAMQFGIFIQFAQERVYKVDFFSPNVRYMESFGQAIHEWLVVEEKELDKLSANHSLNLNSSSTVV